MNQDKKDTCPRCGASFHCGVGDAAPCACSQVTLDAHQLRALRALYPACLCIACLRAIAAGESLAPVADTTGA